MIELGPRYGVVLAVLAVCTAAAALLARLGLSRAILTASARAAAQLAVVSLLIVAVLKSWGLTVLFIALMSTVASITSGRRISRDRTGWWAGAAIVAGVAPTFALLVGSGVVPPKAVSVVPIAGILIGGAMTATSLAGRRALDELRTRYGEYEAALSLGFTDRDAALEICRPSAAHALVPALDQTRTVGLVTLPGAFVGVLLGGASPLAAGAAQLLVLIGLLTVETVAVLVTIELIARRRITWP
jgi:putative ABC transport system permease protein